MKKLWLSGLLLALLVAPAASAASRCRVPGRTQARRVTVPAVGTAFKTNTGPVSPHAKIFLVAGSSLTSAFAREIVDQRKLWLAAGFHEDEIECYYPVPLQEDLLADPRHFLALGPELSSCHQVSVATLAKHLRTIAAEDPKPPFIYLYLTSHGDQPISATIQEARSSDSDYWELQRESHYPVFDQFQVVVEGLPDGTATSLELLGALRAGMSADELYLTPGSLSRMLAGFGNVPKYVVIQGCFSGGFIESSARDPSDGVLAKLPDITVLTAARHDRSSFGCEPGGTTTFYGGAFNDALAKVIADPRKLDWDGLSETVRARVQALEKRQKTTPPSLPQFFTHQGEHGASRAP